MSGSETGLMATNRDSGPFTMGLQNMQLSFVAADGPAVYKPVRSSASPPPQYQPNSGLNMNMPVKRKRGRPRRYGPDNNGGMSLGLVPTFTVSQPSSGVDGGGSSPTVKKMRGRPLGSTGIGFTPHVLNVRTGEDISSKIMGFSQNGPRAVCVLSANGTISTVTLRHPTDSSGTVTYEGRFEILSLSGSFLLVENNGQRSRTGGLSVSLSAPEGNVLGGSVAGLLIAASPVQIVVGSFLPDGQKEPKHVAGHMEQPSPTLPCVAPTQNSPHSRGIMSEPSCGAHGSPPHQNTGGPYNNTNLTMPWK